EVIQDGASRRKLRRWLLLLTRMALVAALVLLFARPFFPETTRRDGDRLRVILIDRSASMGMPGTSGRLIDDAVAAAIDVAGELGSDAKIVWAWFDRQVRPMAESTTRPSPPRGVVGDTDYFSALSWARDRCAAFPESFADVVMVTDLQQSGLGAESTAIAPLQFPVDVPLRVIDVGRPAANNLAITSVSPPAKRLSASRELTIAATLFNYGNLPFEEVPVTAVVANGARTVRMKKSVDVLGGQAEELRFELGNLEPGRWQVTLGMDVEDDLAADNRRMTAVEIADPVEVLLIDRQRSSDIDSESAYYLRAALENRNVRTDDENDFENGDFDRSQDEEPSGTFGPRVVYLLDDALPVLDPGRTPLVVLSDSSIASAPLLARLEKYVRGGGKLLVFAGDSDPAMSSVRMWNESKLAPGRMQAVRRSGASPFRLAEIDAMSTMLSPFSDPQQGDLTRLSFDQFLVVEPDASTRVLARFDAGYPAMTRQPLGTGSVVWFLSSADARWSRWTYSPLYLPLVRQMAADLLNLTGEGPIRYRRVG
ncbi:MAG: hypothetical protein AAGA03_20280, partial [Planctomycetota bacterium]